ncbi:unnamed protein product, partial [Schistosoma turkestanicum]
ASTGRHVNFSGDTEINSSSIYDDNNPRRSTYNSSVRSVEHSKLGRGLGCFELFEVIYGEINVR